MLEICSKDDIYNEEKYAHGEKVTLPDLEIEKCHFPLKGYLNTCGSSVSIKDQISKPICQTTECSKEDISYIQDRRSKMEIIGFVTPIGPIPEENHKSDKNLLPLECEGTMECHAWDSDAVGLDARVEGVVCEPIDLQNNIQVHDVELTVLGNYTGRGLPLDFLESKTTGGPIKGYPVDVEALEDCSTASIDHLLAVKRIEKKKKKRLSRGHDGRWMKRTPLHFPTVSTGRTKENSNEDPVLTTGRTKENSNKDPVLTTGQTKENLNKEPVLTTVGTKENSNKDPILEEASLLLTLAAKASLLHT